MKYTEYPRLAPGCKYVAWIVGLSPTHTTNPMTKSAALKMIKERHKNNKYATLIKTWICVSAKKN